MAESSTEKRERLQDWNLRRIDRYAEQVEQGEHDPDCEQRARSSLCHCSKRRREREGKTTLPELWFHFPTCSGCNQEVEGDGDGFNCPRCHVQWGRNVTDGDRADSFTDDHGASPFGGEQFGDRLIERFSLPSKGDES